MSNPTSGSQLPGAFEAPVPYPTPGLDAAAFDTVGQTVRHAAGAVEGLRDILERLEGSIARAVDHRQTEEQFGHLFLRAQAFVDASIAEAQERARLLVAESEREASRIVSAARDEAARVVAEGHRPARLPVEAAQQLQSTVAHFGEVNRELLHELTTLGQLLTGRPPVTASQPTPAQTLAPPLAAELADTRRAPGCLQAPAPPPPSSSSGYWDGPRHAATSPQVQTNRRGSTFALRSLEA